MVWYILAFALSVSFAYAAHRQKEIGNAEAEGGLLRYCSSYYRMAVCSFLPVFLVAAVRYEVGTDWPIYWDYYQWINVGAEGFSEELFNLINKLVGCTVNDFQGLIALIAFLTYFFVFKAIYEQSVCAPLSVLVFFVSGIFFISMNQLRQAIAMAVMLYAYKYVRERKVVRYYIWCIVAAHIHFGALLYLPVYFIARYKPTFRRYVTIFLAFVIALPVLRPVFEFFIKFTKYEWYLTSVFNSGNAANDFYLSGFLFQSVLLVIMAYYHFTSDTEDLAYDGMLNSYFISLITLLFTPVISQVLRVSYYFGYCQILLVPRTILLEKNRTRRIVLCILIVGMYTVKLLYDTYLMGWNGVIPYQTFFTK